MFHMLKLPPKAAKNQRARSSGASLCLLSSWSFENKISFSGCTLEDITHLAKHLALFNVMSR